MSEASENTNEPVRLRRAFVLTLELQADTRNDLIGELRHLEFMIASEQLAHGVSGGYSTGSVYDLNVDESITHDLYMEQLNEYLGAKKDT